MELEKVVQRLVKEGIENYFKELSEKTYDSASFWRYLGVSPNWKGGVELKAYCVHYERTQQGQSLIKGIPGSIAVISKDAETAQEKALVKLSGWKGGIQFTNVREIPMDSVELHELSVGELLVLLRHSED